MKMPKMSSGIDRFGVNSAAETDGILPSWGIKLPKLPNLGKLRCQAQCRVSQAAGVANCGGDVACTANAIAAGEACFSDC